MLSHFFAFILLGIVQIVMTAWGGYLSVRSLPANEKKMPHILGIVAFGALAVLLTVWIGYQTYHSERDSTESQRKLNQELDIANKKLEQAHDSQEYMKGQLSVIASLIQKGNKADLQQLAVSISDALHPSQSSPCLRPLRYSTLPLKHMGEGGNGWLGPYSLTLIIANPNGIKAHTSIQVFLWDGVSWIEPAADLHDYIAGGGGGGSSVKLFTIVTQSDIPKGHPISYALFSNTVPVKVRCVDLAEVLEPLKTTGQP
jgi:hypothetical protein